MAVGNDDRPVPVVARQQRQVTEQVMGSGSNRAINSILRNHLRNLLRRSLMQIQPHIRVPTPELTDHIRQNVARLRVSGADGKASPALITQLRGEVLDA